MIVYVVSVKEDLRPEKREEAIGIFTSRELAQKAIKENWADLSDHASYSYAIIQPYEMNVIYGSISRAGVPEAIQFYMWVGEAEDGSYVEITTPPQYERMCGFGIT